MPKLSVHFAHDVTSNQLALTVGLSTLASLIAAIVVAFLTWQKRATPLWRQRRQAIKKTLGPTGDNRIVGNQLLHDVKKARRAHRKARTPKEFNSESRAYADVRRTWGHNPDAVEALAMFHRDEADYLWPADDRPSKFRAGYHYSLASCAAEESGNAELAGDYAHYAGHRFRELGEMRRAAAAYLRSAKQYSVEREGHPEGKRSARRAVGCLRAIEEWELADRLAAAYGFSRRSTES